MQEIKRDIWYNISKETRRTFLCYTPYKEAIKEIEQTLATLKPETQEKYKKMPETDCLRAYFGGTIDEGSKPLQF